MPRKGAAKGGAKLERKSSSKPIVKSDLTVQEINSPKNYKDPFGNSLKDTSRIGLNATGAQSPKTAQSPKNADVAFFNLKD